MAAAIILSVMLVVACQEGTKKPNNASLDSENLCDAQPFQKLVGQDREQVFGVKLPSMTRILGPNSIMTMDYRADRLNIYLDRHGIVEKVSCG